MWVLNWIISYHHSPLWIQASFHPSLLWINLKFHPSLLWIQTNLYSSVLWIHESFHPSLILWIKMSFHQSHTFWFSNEFSSISLWIQIFYPTFLLTILKNKAEPTYLIKKFYKKTCYYQHQLLPTSSNFSTIQFKSIICQLFAPTRTNIHKHFALIDLTVTHIFQAHVFHLNKYTKCNDHISRQSCTYHTPHFFSIQTFIGKRKRIQINWALK